MTDQLFEKEIPIPNSYWVEPGKILAGEYPRNIDEVSSRAKIDSLLDAGIGVFIDLTEEVDGLSPYSQMLGERAVHRRFPIRDVSVPQSKTFTREILNAIDRHLAQGQKVYIHCWGGIGRTGMVVGCWLARHGAGGAAALEKLRELWRKCPKSAFRRSPETHAQETYIITWNETEEKNIS